jgi:hypothetical protein
LSLIENLTFQRSAQPRSAERMVWTVHLEKELFMSRKFASSVVLATLLNIFSTTPPNTPIAASYLMERTGESIRVVRDGIQRLIQEYKMPIISDRNGSYVLSTRPAVIEPEIMRPKQERYEHAMRLWKRMFSVSAVPLRIRRSMRSSARRMAGTFDRTR